MRDQGCLEDRRGSTDEAGAEAVSDEVNPKLWGDLVQSADERAENRGLVPTVPAPGFSSASMSRAGGFLDTIQGSAQVHLPGRPVHRLLRRPPSEYADPLQRVA